MVLISFDSQYRHILVKNRRTLGVASKSVSFCTDTKNLPMHIPIEVNLGGKLYKIPQMAYLSRLYILGIDPKYYQSGANHVQIKNNEAVKSMPGASSDQLKQYFSQLPKLISFRLFEYEKQLFYFKCLVNDKVPVIELRNLYHTELEVELIQTDDIELLIGLLFGLTTQNIQDVVTFSDLSER